jgi:hypothetical protein
MEALGQCPQTKRVFAWLGALNALQRSGAMTLRAVAAALTAWGIATARGGDWNATQVANVLKRG